MSAANDQQNCFCKCYNMFAWERTFNTDSIHLNEKPYSCGRCLKGFSPSDNVIVHNLIPTLNLLSTYNIFNKNAITKMHITTYNIIHDSTIKLCSIREVSNECLTMENSNEKYCLNSETSNSSLSLAQCNENPECSGRTVASSLTKNPYACVERHHQSGLTANVRVKEKLHHCCSKCNSLFEREEHLVSHMRLHDHTVPYCCSLCIRVFPNKVALSNHISTHYVKTSKDSYSCNTCWCNFLSKKDMIQHLSMHVTQNPCSLCKGIHKLRNGFAFFYCVHREGILRHVCHICNKRYLRKQSLRSHLNLHNLKKPYVCNICRKAYHLQASLYSHYVAYPAHNRSLPTCLTDEKTTLDINEQNRTSTNALRDGKDALDNNEPNGMCIDAVTYGKPLGTNELNRICTDTVIDEQDALDISETNRLCLDAVTDGTDSSDNNEQIRMYIDVVAEHKKACTEVKNMKKENICDTASHESLK